MVSGKNEVDLEQNKMTKQVNTFSPTEFAKFITSEPKLKGKLKLATPKEMKTIWRTTE
jgi:hypothetical protein